MAPPGPAAQAPNAHVREADFGLGYPGGRGEPQLKKGGKGSTDQVVGSPMQVTFCPVFQLWSCSGEQTEGLRLTSSGQSQPWERAARGAKVRPPKKAKPSAKADRRRAPKRGGWTCGAGGWLAMGELRGDRCSGHPFVSPVCTGHASLKAVGPPGREGRVRVVVGRFWAVDRSSRAHRGPARNCRWEIAPRAGGGREIGPGRMC
jgi:hypothetical protein